MGNLKFEVARALKSGAKQSGKFSGIMRQTSLNNLVDGMEFTVPAYTSCFEQPIRGSYKTDEHGNEITENGKKVLNTTQYIFCEDSNGKAHPLYPGTFSKARQEVIENNGLYTRASGLKVASGEVVDFLQQFVDTEDAMQALVTMTLPAGEKNPNASEVVNAIVPEGKGKKIHVSMEKIQSVRFEARDKDDSQLTKKDVRTENIPTFTWV